jgi:hypothetical protein
MDELLYIGGIVAIIKILAMVVLFIMVIYSTAIENDPKRKFTELITCIVIIVVIISIQTVVPKLVGQNSEALTQILTNWDPKVLFDKK